MATTAVAEVLQHIYDTKGELTPDLVWEEARNPVSPLHAYIEWDEGKAAKAHQLNQCARLIRSVRVVYAETPEGPKDLRAWVNVQDVDGRGGRYRPVEEVVQDDFIRTLTLRRFEREWMSFRRRYDHLSEFADLILGDLRDKAE